MIAYEIKQRLGISQAPACDLRTKLLVDVEKEKSGTQDLISQ